MAVKAGLYTDLPSAQELAIRDPYAPDPEGMADFGTRTALGVYETLSGPSKEQQPQPTGPAVLYNPQTSEVFVNGLQFDVDDHQSALQSVDFLDAERREPESGPWRTITPEEYGKYVNDIQDPSFGRLITKNLGRGKDIGDMLFGRGLQYLGMDETGQAMVDRNIEEMRKTSPYERMFTDIDSAEGFADWMVANFAQGIPIVVESVLAGFAGFIAGATAPGSAVTGGLLAAGKTIGRIATNKEFKKAAIDAIEKRAAGEALNEVEKGVIKRVAAMGAVTANSYALGIADIYGEQLESEKGDASRIITAFGAIPYAAFEALPEIIIGGRLLSNWKAKNFKGGAVPSEGALARYGKGIGLGATLEGVTEASQEGLLMWIDNIVNDTQHVSDEVLTRLVNSFAAGAGIGGPLGGIASFKTADLKKPLDILRRDKTQKAKEEVAEEEGKDRRPTGPIGPVQQELDLEQVDPFVEGDVTIRPIDIPRSREEDIISPEVDPNQQELDFDTIQNQIDLDLGPEQLDFFPPTQTEQLARTDEGEFVLDEAGIPTYEQPPITGPTVQQVVRDAEGNIAVDPETGVPVPTETVPAAPLVPEEEQNLFDPTNVRTIQDQQIAAEQAELNRQAAVAGQLDFFPPTQTEVEGAKPKPKPKAKPKAKPKNEAQYNRAIKSIADKKAPKMGNMSLATLNAIASKIGTRVVKDKLKQIKNIENKIAKLSQEQRDALQVKSTEKVDVREQTGTGSKVPEGDKSEPTTTTTGKGGSKKGKGKKRILEASERASEKKGKNRLKKKKDKEPDTVKTVLNRIMPNTKITQEEIDKIYNGFKKDYTFAVEVYGGETIKNERSKKSLRQFTDAYAKKIGEDKEKIFNIIWISLEMDPLGGVQLSSDDEDAVVKAKAKADAEKKSKQEEEVEEDSLTKLKTDKEEKKSEKKITVVDKTIPKASIQKQLENLIRDTDLGTHKDLSKLSETDLIKFTDLLAEAMMGDTNSQRPINKVLKSAGLGRNIKEVITTKFTDKTTAIEELDNSYNSFISVNVTKADSLIIETGGKYTGKPTAIGWYAHHRATNHKNYNTLEAFNNAGGIIPDEFTESLKTSNKNKANRDTEGKEDPNNIATEIANILADMLSKKRNREAEVGTTSFQNQTVVQGINRAFSSLPKKNQELDVIIAGTGGQSIPLKNFFSDGKLMGEIVDGILELQPKVNIPKTKTKTTESKAPPKKGDQLKRLGQTPKMAEFKKLQTKVSELKRNGLENEDGLAVALIDYFNRIVEDSPIINLREAIEGIKDIANVKDLNIDSLIRNSPTFRNVLVGEPSGPVNRTKDKQKYNAYKNVLMEVLIDTHTRYAKSYLPFSLTDTVPENPIAFGRAKLLVKSFVKKLKIKPKVVVVESMDDLLNLATVPKILKTKLKNMINPYYVRGISHGDTVYVVTNMIESDQHLKMVIAHEAVGHFGLHSILPADKLGKSLTDIYEKEHRVRREVDKRLAEYKDKGYNVNKLITIEEVIADRITAIDGSIIRRLWDMILRALDALGITLDNGAESRYLIGMARRYVREGTTLDGIGVFSNEQIERNMERMRIEGNVRLNADTAAEMRGGVVNTLFNFDATAKGLGIGGITEFIGKSGRSLKSWWKQLQEFSQTMDNHALKSEGAELLQRYLNLTVEAKNSIQQALVDEAPIINTLQSLGVLTPAKTKKDKADGDHASLILYAAQEIAASRLSSDVEGVAPPIYKLIEEVKKESGFDSVIDQDTGEFNKGFINALFAKRVTAKEAIDFLKNNNKEKYDKMMQERKDLDLGDIEDRPYKIFTEARNIIDYSKFYILEETMLGTKEEVASRKQHLFDSLPANTNLGEKGSALYDGFIEFIENLTDSYSHLAKNNQNYTEMLEVFNGMKPEDIVKLPKAQQDALEFLNKADPIRGKEAEGLPVKQLHQMIEPIVRTFMRALHTGQSNSVLQAFAVYRKAPMQYSTILKNFKTQATKIATSPHTRLSKARPEGEKLEETVDFYYQDFIKDFNTLRDSFTYLDNVQTLSSNSPIHKGFIDEQIKVIEDSIFHDNWGNLKWNKAIAPHPANKFDSGIDRHAKMVTSQIEAVLTNQIWLQNSIETANTDFLYTSLRSYIASKRRGKLKMRVEVGRFDEDGTWIANKDRDGKFIIIPERIKAAMPYMQSDDRKFLEQNAENINEFLSEFKEEIQKSVSTVEDGVTDKNEIDHAKKLNQEIIEFLNKVEFNAVVEDVQQSSDEAFVDVPLAKMFSALTSLGINVSPSKRESLIVHMSREGSAVRQGLEKKFNPGWDEDLIRNAYESSMTNAHIAAKARHYHNTIRTMKNSKLWRGDQKKLNRLKKEYDTASKEIEDLDNANKPVSEQLYAKYFHIRQEYHDYRFKFHNTAAPGKGIFSIDDDGNKVEPLVEGAKYRDKSAEIFDWFSSSDDMEHNIDNVLNRSDIGRTMKSFAVIAQLGGNVATALINLFSLLTHTVPTLGTYNSARGFGGGFGMTKSANQIMSAISDVGAKKFGNVDKLQEIESKWGDKSKTKFGLTYDEVKFLLDESVQGILSAATPRAYMGIAKRGPGPKLVQKAGEAWMWVFGYTEKLNRRTTALAAYRLYKERKMAAMGLTKFDLKNKELVDYVTQNAVTAVNQSQGNYTQPNRPAWGRHSLGQYLFTYKVFQIITVQLVRNLPPSGRLYMLGMLFLLAGLKGLPFGEDLIDLVDTVGARAGFTKGNIELAAREIIEDMAPGLGLSQFVMKGGIDQLTDWSISSRLSMGNLIPGSDIFRLGQSSGATLRGIKDVSGPVFANTYATVATMYGLTKVRDMQKFIDVMRSNPISGVRNMFDAWTYHDSGYITNSQYKVMVKDPTVKEMLGRMVGFLPHRQTQQNDAIRLSKYHVNFMKAIKTEFVQQAVKAKLNKDQEALRAVKERVKDFNRNVDRKDKIHGFMDSVSRSFKQLKLPAAKRYAKTVPKDYRKNAQDIAKMIGIDT